MRWIDIITLCSSTATLEPLDNEFILSIINNKRTESLKGFKIYRRHAIETDLSVHLFWASENVEQKGNTLSHHLIRFLKQYGLVNHSIWVENAHENETGDIDRWDI